MSLQYFKVSTIPTNTPFTLTIKKIGETVQGNYGPQVQTEIEIDGTMYNWSVAATTFDRNKHLFYEGSQIVIIKEFSNGKNYYKYAASGDITTQPQNITKQAHTPKAPSSDDRQDAIFRGQALNIAKDLVLHFKPKDMAAAVEGIYEAHKTIYNLFKDRMVDGRWEEENKDHTVRDESGKDIEVTDLPF